MPHPRFRVAFVETPPAVPTEAEKLKATVEATLARSERLRAHCAEVIRCSAELRAQWLQRSRW